MAGEFVASSTNCDDFFGHRSWNYTFSFGIGAGAEVRSPMGIAIMGGFTTSTLLTLVVVPVLFTYIDDLQHWILHLLQAWIYQETQT